MTGKLLKGGAEFKIVRSAFAWSCVPFVINVILWIVLAFMFGQLLFMNTAGGYAFTQGQVAFLFFLIIARIAVGIWSLVIYINALAEVQQFSILRAIGNVLLAAILLGVFFWLVSFLLTGA
jgi:hypothetical protein